MYIIILAQLFWINFLIAFRKVRIEKVDRRQARKWIAAMLIPLACLLFSIVVELFVR